MSEITVLRAGLFGWRKPAPERGPGVFPYHTRNGYPALLGAILMVVVVETLAVHFLVSLWKEPVAWVLTTLGVYTLLWLMGDYQIARQNPIRVENGTLYLQTGARWNARVPLGLIQGVEKERPEGEGVVFTLFGDPDFWIELSEPVPVTGPFGIRKSATVLGLGADDPKALREALSAGAAGPATGTDGEDEAPRASPMQGE